MTKFRFAMTPKLPGAVLLIVLSLQWLTGQSKELKPNVYVPLRAADANGNLINLTLKNIVLRENGREIIPSRFSGPESPVLINLVFDVTSTTPYIEAVKTTLKDFFDVLPPDLEFMIVQGELPCPVLQPRTNQAEKLKKALDNIRYVKTPVFMTTMLGMSRNADTRYLLEYGIRTAVLYITDSDAHKELPATSIQEFRSQLPIYIISLEPVFTPVFVLRLPGGPADALNAEYDRVIGEMTAALGGSVEFVTQPQQVSASLHRLFHQIHGTCFAAYTASPVNPQENRPITINLLDKNGNPLNAKVIHKKVYNFRKPGAPIIR